MAVVPIGYRFHPTEEELVTHYLKNKLEGNDSLINNTISQIHLYSFDPWDLPEHSKVKSDDSEWFFFNKLNYTSRNRCDRKTNGGYWKITGKERQIKATGTGEVIGTKKTLVFYKRRPDGVKTNWVMHEYHAPHNKYIVLCRVVKNPEKKEKKVKRKASNLLAEELTRGEEEHGSENTSYVTQESTTEHAIVLDNAVDEIPSLVQDNPVAGNENNNAGFPPFEAILEQDAGIRMQCFLNLMYSSIDGCREAEFPKLKNSLLAGDDRATSDST